MQDPDRIPNTDRSSCVMGDLNRCGGNALTSNIVLDRLPATAMWNLGVRALGLLDDSLDVEGWAYNVLDQHAYQTDPNYDLAPTSETQPLPALGRSFFGNVRYRF